MPSKLYGIMAAGRAVLALGAPDGAVAREIKRHGMGVQLDDASPASWPALVNQAVSDRPRLVRWGARARDAYAQHYRTPDLLGAWSGVFAGLGDERARATPLAKPQPMPAHATRRVL